MRVEYREEPCRSALNRVRGMGFEWSLNPYMGCAHRCTFCYVRGFEKRADRPSDDRYGTSIRVKINIAEALRAELARPTWKRDYVLVGAATDPYQPIEGRYRLTRGCIQAFAEYRTPFGIITRGPLVVRDLDVLQEASKRAAVDVNVSVPTLDERIWRATEPGTSHPRARLAAIRKLAEGGIRVKLAMAPMLPGLSDDPAKMLEVVRAARDAGATEIWSTVLNLRPGTKEHFLEHLAKEWPEELERYQQLYAGRGYLPGKLTAPISRKIGELKREVGIRDRRVVKYQPPPEPEQLDLLGLG